MMRIHAKTYQKVSQFRSLPMTLQSTAVKPRTQNVCATYAKITFIHFNKRNIKPGESEIKINETMVKSSESVRFLGIIFDYRLTFKEQINNVHKRCLRAMNIIKFIRGTWWGASPETLLILYKTFVHSIIDYGCFIYFPTKPSQIQKLEKI